MTTIFPFEAGLLIRWQIRRELEKARFQFPNNFSFHESKGLLSSEFILRFTDSPVLEQYIVSWLREVVADQERD